MDTRGRGLYYELLQVRDLYLLFFSKEGGEGVEWVDAKDIHLSSLKKSMPLIFDFSASLLLSAFLASSYLTYSRIFLS